MCLKAQGLERTALGLGSRTGSVDFRDCKPIASLANLRALTYDTIGGRGGAKQAAVSS